MRNVLILDTETTGLTQDDVAIEVGVIVYSVPHACTIEAHSWLIQHHQNAAESVNRIPAAALLDALAPNDVWLAVLTLATECDAILAHNAEFDRRFVPPSVRDVSAWICTQADVVWPKQQRPQMSLVALALAHDLGISGAHRALADCDLIARLLTRSRELGSDLDVMLTLAMRPKVTLMACVSYEDRDKARDAGFHWNGIRRQWLRRMVQEDANFPFACRVVEDESQ